MSTAPVLEFRDVSRSFVRGTPVLTDVSFSVEREQVVALLGRNGSGKTTLVQIAMGMLFPQAGSVRVFGLSPTEQPVAVKLRVGYVAEAQVLPSESTIQEILALHRYLFPTWDAALERQLLSRFGLALNSSKISQLSKGQARQVALICAVCHRPELLILDEPAGGLDPVARREFLETSIQLLNREGSSILFSSHHMGDVERLGGRVVLLDDGKVRLDRELDELRESYCLALIPRSAASHREIVERIPGCMRVKPVASEWRAMFEGSPEQVRAQLAQSLGVSDARCASIPLEEMFVELLGTERLAEAS